MLKTMLTYFWKYFRIVIASPSRNETFSYPPASTTIELKFRKMLILAQSFISIRFFALALTLRTQSMIVLNV